MAKTWRRLPAKARQQLSDERLFSVCFEHLRLLNFAPDLSVCCGACLYSIGAEASID
jgi:hypothetical protein